MCIAKRTHTVRSLLQDHLNKITPWFWEVPEDLSKASQRSALKGGLSRVDY